MSDYQEARRRLDAPQFVQGLRETIDGDEWTVLEQYCRRCVRWRLRQRFDTVTTDMIDDGTQAAMVHIWSHLAAYRAEGRFSAFVNTLIDDALRQDPVWKNLHQATRRLVTSAHRFSSPDQERLAELASQLPPPLHTCILGLLPAYASAIPAPPPAPGLSRACTELIRLPGFEGMLHALAHTGILQAKTALEWFCEWKQTAITEQVEDHHTATAFDDTLMFELIGQFARCFLDLKAARPRAYEACWLRLLKEEPYDAVVAQLRVTVGRVKVLVHEGRTLLRDCLRRKQEAAQ